MESVSNVAYSERILMLSSQVLVYILALSIQVLVYILMLSKLVVVYLNSL